MKDSLKEDPLPAAFLQKNLIEMDNLQKKGLNPTLIKPHHMAKMMNEEHFIINMLNIEEIRNQNSTTIIEMFVGEDTEQIKSFLSFVNKYFYEAVMDKTTFIWTRRVRPGFENFVSKDEKLFYLQKLDNLGGRSITQYVVDGGDDLLVLREQLLDLMVKIDRKIYYEDSEKDGSQKRVINNIKRDIPSSRNLSNCLESVETRYKWGHLKKIAYIAKSFVRNIVLGYTMYGLDVGTDLDYSLKMLGTNSTELCHQNIQQINNRILPTGSFSIGETRDCLEDSVYLQQGLIGLAHVVLPQTVALLIGLFSLPWVSLPLPLITRAHRFLLDVRHARFKGREEPTEDEQDEKLMETDEKRQEFQRKKETYKKKMAGNKDIQEKMKVNSRDILMAQQVECIGESSFQFFIQTLWLMPTLLVLWWDTVRSKGTTNLEDLFNIRILSVAMSFISMGISYTNIRYKQSCYVFLDRNVRFDLTKNRKNSYISFPQKPGERRCDGDETLCSYDGQNCSW